MKRYFVLICMLLPLLVDAQQDKPLNKSRKSINSEEVILIGGIKQVISIKGTDDSNPVLLYLHGGPGEPVMDRADAFTSKLQEKFVVVQWDQREGGKTLLQNSTNQPLTVSLMQNDTREMVEALLKMFGRKKLFLVGHSWGTVLGFHIADKYPNLLNAFIAISPFIKSTDSVWFEKVVAFEKEKKNEKALQELSEVKIPYETFEQMFTARKWLSDFEGEPVPDSLVAMYLKMLEPFKNTWFPMYQREAQKINLYKTISSVKCPVYFFVGRTDNVTQASVSEDYFNKLKAPKKKFFWFEKSAHSIPMTEPELMQEIIINQILPENLR